MSTPLNEFIWSLEHVTPMWEHYRAPKDTQKPFLIHSYLISMASVWVAVLWLCAAFIFFGHVSGQKSQLVYTSSNNNKIYLSHNGEIVVFQ